MKAAPKKSPAQLNREIAEVLARKGKRNHSTISDDAKIRDALARFPPTFGLRGFPGDVFRLSPTSSYVSGGNVMLYTQRKEGDHWLDFSKGTEPELRGEIVPLPSAGGRTTKTPVSRAHSSIPPVSRRNIPITNPPADFETKPASEWQKKTIIRLSKRAGKQPPEYLLQFTARDAYYAIIDLEDEIREQEANE